MKHGIKILCGLRYKLRMMDNELTGSTSIYGNNVSIIMIYNIPEPKSTLKKKSNSRCHYAVRGADASGECLTSQHIPTLKNRSDLLKKVLYGKERQDLVGGVLFDLYDESDSLFDCYVLVATFLYHKHISSSGICV